MSGGPDINQQAMLSQKAGKGGGGHNLALFNMLGHAFDDVMAFLGLKDRSMKAIAGGEGGEGGGGSGGGGGGDSSMQSVGGSGPILTNTASQQSFADVGNIRPSSTPSFGGDDGGGRGI